MKRLLLLFLLVCGFTISRAQYLEGPRYRGIAESVGLAGTEIGGGLSTSHGFQVNKHVFVGAGVGFYYYENDDTNYRHSDETRYALPLFATARFNFGSARVTPYLDLKAGYSPVDISGFYASPSFGIRIGITGKFAINVATGYACQQYDYTEKTYSRGKYYRHENEYTQHDYSHCFTLSVGVEW